MKKIIDGISKPGAIPLSLFTVIGVLPVLLAVGYAALYSIGLADVRGPELTLEHWAELFQGEFLISLLHSLWIAIASTLISLLLAFTMLFWLREHLKSNHVYRMLFLPLTVPPVVVGFAVYQMWSGGGIFSRVSYHAGLISDISQFPELVHDPYGLGIILAHIFIGFPFFLILLINTFQKKKLDELEIVAISLGASNRDCIMRIHLPVLLISIFPVAALYTIFFMGAYEIPLILGQSSPQMITVLILEKLQRYNMADIPVAYAMALLYAVLCIATILWLMMRYRKRVEA